MFVLPTTLLSTILQVRVCTKPTDAAYRTAGASLDEGGEGREERGGEGRAEREGRRGEEGRERGEERREERGEREERRGEEGREW